MLNNFLNNIRISQEYTFISTFISFVYHCQTLFTYVINLTICVIIFFWKFISLFKHLKWENTFSLFLYLLLPVLYIVLCRLKFPSVYHISSAWTSFYMSPTTGLLVMNSFWFYLSEKKIIFFHFWKILLLGIKIIGITNW